MCKANRTLFCLCTLSIAPVKQAALEVQWLNTDSSLVRKSMYTHGMMLFHEPLRAGLSPATSRQRSSTSRELALWFLL